jgi:hypothetical protein
LLELVIVLIILAALTTVAVRSLGPVADQARYEKTQRTLIEIEQAILLRSIEPGGIVSYSGFVADMGRLPRRLDELWIRTGVRFSVSQFSSGVDDSSNNDISVPVLAGWKGPYLSLPPGMDPEEDSLRDGFGNEFDEEYDSSGYLINVRSLRSGLGDAYDRELSLPRDFSNPAVYRSMGQIQVRVASSTPIIEPNVDVRLYGPEDGQAALVATADLTKDTIPIGGMESFSGMLVDPNTNAAVELPAGPYTLWAYSHNNNNNNNNNNAQLIRQTIKSQIMIVPGANTPKVLTLLPLSPP